MNPYQDGPLHLWILPIYPPLGPPLTPDLAADLFNTKVKHYLDLLPQDLLATWVTVQSYLQIHLQ